MTIFENTTLIKRLTALFQESDPSLSMMSTIWLSMRLAASVRSADRQHLFSVMHNVPQNERFLATFNKVVFEMVVERH